ncbi:hypothetical protein HQ447_16675, partial [bacterium]|nr:hypothetical protein [bacterium]
RLMFPAVEDPSKFSWDSKLWDQTKPIFRNPVMTATSKPPFRAWTPGYGINEQINANLFGWGDDYLTGSKTKPIPVGRISEPSRTPLVVPYSNWKFAASTFTKTDAMKPFLIDGKFPVLFVDGHVETLVPQEYITRKLGEMPKK